MTVGPGSAAVRPGRACAHRRLTSCLPCRPVRDRPLLLPIFTGWGSAGRRRAANSPFSEWDSIFNEPRLCAAATDRIPSRCTLVLIRHRLLPVQVTEDVRGTRTPCEAVLGPSDPVSSAGQS